MEKNLSLINKSNEDDSISRIDISDIEGIRDKYKNDKIPEDHYLSKVQAWYKAELDITLEKLFYAKKINKEKFKREAKIRIEKINNDFKDRFLDVKKDAVSITASLESLTDKSVALLTKFQEKNWPEEIKERNVKIVMKEIKNMQDSILSTMENDEI